LSADFGPERPKEEDTLLWALRKLYKAEPGWFVEYGKRYEKDYEIQYSALLTAAGDKLPRQQGICAAMDSHLRLLKLAMVNSTGH
jgi:hypothetical protein